MNKLTPEKFKVLRRTFLGTLGVYMTDACPVGCSHCSVSAVSREFIEPNATFFDQFAKLLKERTEIEAVCVTGGEPFAKLDRLSRIIGIVSSAQKRSVVHTSLFWGSANRRNKSAYRKILQDVDIVVSGIDLYHRESIPDETIIDAATDIFESSASLVFQVLVGDGNDSENALYTESLIRRIEDNLGRTFVHVEEIPFLSVGRADQGIEKSKSGHVGNFSFAGCSLANGPVVRMDGEVSPCCNEDLMSKFNQSGSRFTAKSIGEAVDDLTNDYALNMIRDVSPLALAEFFEANQKKPQRTICEACIFVRRAAEKLDCEERERIKNAAKVVQIMGA